MSHRTKLAFNASWEADKAAKAKSNGCRHDSPLSGPIISLYAGPDNVPFFVHANVMCASSHYFFKRFSGPIVPPDRELHLHFPKIDPADMKMFTNAMYGLFWQGHDLKIPVSPDQDILDHVRLYLMGNTFEVPSLRDRLFKAITYLLEKEDDVYISNLSPKGFETYLQSRMSLITLVYSKTNEDDMLRSRLVNSMGLYGDLYYECGRKSNINMERDLEKFFKLVPKFADDLRMYLWDENDFVKLPGEGKEENQLKNLSMPAAQHE